MKNWCEGTKLQDGQSASLVIQLRVAWIQYMQVLDVVDRSLIKLPSY